MTQKPTRSRHLRRALGVALCYVFALQAFFSAHSAALALAQAGDPGGSLIICHGATDRTPDAPDTGKGKIAPCPMCAMASAAGGLPPDTPVSTTAPSVVTVRFVPADIAVTRGSSTARAGLARAPPQFA